MSMRLTTIAAIIIAFVSAAVIARVAHAIIDRALGALDVVGTENRAAVLARGKQLSHALTALAYGVAAIASISLALAFTRRRLFSR